MSNSRTAEQVLQALLVGTAERTAVLRLHERLQGLATPPVQARLLGRTVEVLGFGTTERAGLVAFVHHDGQLVPLNLDALAFDDPVLATFVSCYRCWVGDGGDEVIDADVAAKLVPRCGSTVRRSTSTKRSSVLDRRIYGQVLRIPADSELAKV